MACGKAAGLLSSHIPPPEHVVAPHLPPHHAACLPHYPFIIRQGHHFPGRNPSGHHSETMILIMMKSFLEGIGHPQLLGAYSWSGWLGSLRDGHGQINGRALCLFVTTEVISWEQLPLGYALGRSKDSCPSLETGCVWGVLACL